MARGPKKHLKRINTPRSWLLSKMGGIYATRPSQGPHRLRECLPLAILIKHRLKLALNGREVTLVVQDKEGGFKIDNKIRRDTKFPVGIMDVVSVVRNDEHFRLLYDVKGRFTLVKITPAEAKLKLLKIRHKKVGPNKVPYIVTHDARTIRFPHPDIDEGDTVQYDLEKGQVVSWVKNEVGALVYVIGGNNVGRVGTLQRIERHLGSFDIVYVRDDNGRVFSTRAQNIFVIGSKKPLLTLPREQGLSKTILEEKAEREKAKHKTSTA